jgi:hypothetical protein
VSRTVLLAAVAAASLAGGCGKFKDLLDPPLTEFTSPDGAWKAKFPGAPAEQSKQAFGVTFSMWAKEPFGGKGAYMVGTAELPIPAGESPGMTQKRLDDGVAGSVNAVNGSLLSSAPVMLHNRYPGQELTATVKEPRAGTYRGRIYLVGKRMYIVAVMGVDEFARSAKADEFLDSFALVGNLPPARGGSTHPAERLAFAQGKNRPPEPEPAPAPAGHAIHSTNGKFKARFPEAPKKGSATAGEVTFTTYSATAKGARYEAGYADRPELDGADGKARQEAVDAARDAAAAELGADAKVGKCELVILAGRHRGWEFDAAAGDRSLRGRVYLVGARLYRVAVRGSADAVRDPAADAFLDSFQVVN